MTMIALRDRNENEPVFLRTGKPDQHFHVRWWTALPAIPATLECRAYRRLWRQFADHTMNTATITDGVAKPGSRGFYVEGREDHLVPAFFENFALLPDFQWLDDLLSRLAIPHDGGISDAAWSYSYEEVLAGERRPRIADIVVMWRENKGEAILVIEAKRPGCRRAGLTEKDYPTHRYYLNYRAMRSIDRRHQVLLMDDNDLPFLPDDIRKSPSVITWQELVTIQRCAVERIAVHQDVRNLAVARLTAHYATLGLASSVAPLPDTCADMKRYAELRSLDAPGCLTDWLVGSEFFFAARNEAGMMRPPYDWLAHEPTVLSYDAAGRMKRPFQSTKDREAAIWKL